ncbi:hypothetical protein ACGFIW_01600 [Micromonospora sp. NPDC048935]|uniref:hypothetical protein n=1 Tax=Micromonospora sp. NPDC048935 TaxID=3364262 RepID=UPI0037181183
MSTWRWEAFDSSGTAMIADTLTDPFAETPTEAADLGMARLLIRVEPDYGQLRGWRVRAWADGCGEAWADADEWLQVAEGSRR